MLHITSLPQPHVYKTPQGTLQVMHIGHASLLLQLNNLVIYNDPYGEVADFTGFPKANLMLITHEHYDHLDIPELDKICIPTTTIIGTEAVAQALYGTNVLQNGDVFRWNDIVISAVPAYNIRHRRPDGEPFHPKGHGNGYILNIGGFRIYIAGDTEPIPEMSLITSPDIAFLPKDLPYTMSDDMFIEAARMLKPKTLYPYHYFTLDKVALQQALAGINLRTMVNG